jgi:hypothetical protein
MRRVRLPASPRIAIHHNETGRLGDAAANLVQRRFTSSRPNRR